MITLYRDAFLARVCPSRDPNSVRNCSPCYFIAPVRRCVGVEGGPALTKKLWSCTVGAFLIGSWLPVSLAQECGRLAMPHYWVFWDEIVGCIRIHRAECGACKYGTGIYKVKITEGPQATHDWEPANSYAGACEIVATLKHRKPALDKSAQTDCDLCHPGRHK
jgi:hypothetical protein